MKRNSFYSDALPSNHDSVVVPNKPSSSPHHPNDSRRGSPAKRRRLTITELPLNSTQTPQTTPCQHPCSLPDTQNNLLNTPNNSFTRLPPKTKNRHSIHPPNITGFSNHRQDPSTVQQVAHTIKLREKQKLLIEQRRNSFAGHSSSSLEAFSFSSSNPPTHRSYNPPPTPPPPQNGRCSPHTHRCSPHTACSSPHSVHSQASISRPAPPLSNNHHHHHPNSNFSKILSHNNPVDASPPTEQSLLPPMEKSPLPPPPVINLPSIDQATAPSPGNHSSSPHHQYQTGPSAQTSLNHPNYHKPTPTPDNAPHTNSPSHCPTTLASDSSIASRRGHEIQEKVKNLALAPQNFRPQLLAQSSIKSAPIHSGFLQATAPNGEILKTPLIARTNLAASTGSTKGSVQNHEAPSWGVPNKLNVSQPNSNLHYTSPLHGSIDPPNTAHPNVGGGHSYSKGLARRMTMHSSPLIQVPTLSHLLINSNNRQSHPAPSRGRPSKTANSNTSNQLRPMPRMSTSSSSANVPHHPPQLEKLAPSQNQQPPPFQHHHPAQHPPPDNLHTAPLLRPRPSISSASAGPSQTPGIPPKHMFLQLFETFYDSLSDSKILQSNLEDQIRRSAQLLTLLQQSSNVFEKMLDDRMANIQKEYTRDLQILENRIDKLEAQAAHPDHDPESSTDLISDHHHHHHFGTNGLLKDNDDRDLDDNEDEDVKDSNLFLDTSPSRNHSPNRLEPDLRNENITTKSGKTSGRISDAPHSMSGVRVKVEEATISQD